MEQPPTGTVTFLFTDLEGSTRLWEERPDDMRALVAEHDARFRAAVEENRGYVVKTTGDGLHAAFGRAADAVAAAEAAQATIAEHQAGTHIEIDSEARYEASLRRALGEEFGACYAQGLALDEPAMITFAFAQLAAISDQ